MANILPQQLIEKFQYALNMKVGYIWGKTWELWSAEKQAQYARAYANDKNRAQSVEYGGKWDGHYVTDCSGLFSWAFQQLGSKMYHGSNTMYNSWCTAKGELKVGNRTDGKQLKPGTAVFTGNESNKGHVGLYVGDGWVIEAQGTQAGVVKSRVSLAKWKYWGELKGVNYAVTTVSGGDGNKKEETTTVSTKVEGKGKVNAKAVAIRTLPLATSPVLVRVPEGEYVDFVEPDPAWQRVTYNGKTGYMMTKFIDK